MARPPSHDPRRTAWERISPTGDTQAGVARPMTPQRCALVSVGDAPVEGVPSALELARDVWIDEGPLRWGTVCVIRRFILDIDGFAALSPADQDAVIGRRRHSGAPSVAAS